MGDIATEPSYSIYPTRRNVTEVELKEVFDHFKIVDADGNYEFIPKVSIVRALRLLHLNPSLSGVMQLVDECDLDGNGTIDFSEFSLFVDRFQATKVNPRNLIEAFQAFDVNNDGVLDRNELYDGMASSGGETLNDEEFDEMFNECDKDGSNNISVIEFVRVHCPGVSDEEIYRILNDMGYLTPEMKEANTRYMRTMEERRLAAEREAEARARDEEERRRAADERAQRDREAREASANDAERKREEEEERKKKAEEARKARAQNRQQKAQDGCCVVM
jgi:calmodulin